MFWTLILPRHEVPRRSRRNNGPTYEVVDTIHELNLIVGHLVKFILVALGLEGKPEHAAKRHDGWIEFITTSIRIVVPCEGNVREPEQERKDPEILVWGKPITRCKKQCKHNALYVE